MAKVFFLVLSFLLSAVPSAPPAFAAGRPAGRSGAVLRPRLPLLRGHAGVSCRGQAAAPARCGSTSARSISTPTMCSSVREAYRRLRHHDPGRADAVHRQRCDRRLRRGDEAGDRAEDRRLHRRWLPLPARPRCPARPAAIAPTLTFTAVVTAAAVDAINPCAFAVLIILITAVLGAGSRRRVLYAGLAFSLAIFISYYLMGLGVYSAVEAAGATRRSTSWSACSPSSSACSTSRITSGTADGSSWRCRAPGGPPMKRIIQRVTSVPGAFLTGFVVSLFLLPCTSGPYIVILGLLGKTATRPQALPGWCSTT